jgi:DNA-binding CsgD family transcriptional regulator
MRLPAERLSAQDLREVLHLGRVALECGDTGEMLTETLSLLESVFRTGSSNFFFSRTSANELDYNRPFSNTIQDTSFELFRHYYHELDPFVAVLPASVAPRVLTTKQVITYKDFLAGEYYNDFLRPQAIYSQMSFFLWNNTQLLGCISLFRPKDAPVFSSVDRAKAELLLPYLSEALGKCLSVEAMKQQKMFLDCILDALPFQAVVLVNESFEPVHWSEKASAVLAELYDRGQAPHDGLNTFAKVLRFRLKGDGGQSNASCPCYPVPLTRVRLTSAGNDRKAWAVLIPLMHQGRRVFAVCIRSQDEEEGVGRALAHLGFTSRETEVVLLLSRGLKNHEIGKQLYISEYTVENHLRSIFRKLGVSNRTAATRRLLQIMRPVGVFDFPEQ